MDFSQPFGLWAYVVLAIVVMIEGPVATLAGAVAASAGLMDPYGVFLAASSGNLLSDIVWYFVGYLGKTGWLFRNNRLFGLKKQQIEQLEDDIHAHAAKLLFMSKLTLGFSIPTLIATGLAHVPMRRWFWALTGAEVIWTGTLTILGYHFGTYLRTLERGVEVIAVVGSLLFVSVLIYYVSSFRRRLREKQ